MTETPVTENSPSPHSKKFLTLLRVTISMLSVTLGIACLIATLFTAWTPGGSSFFTRSTQAAFSYEPLPTQTRLYSSTSTPHARPYIGIVAGHWGNGPDAGAVCADGLAERDVNLDIATRVQKSLVSMGYDVDLLKEFDPKLDGFRASAIISIHNDSCFFINSQATGFKVASAMFNPHPEISARLTACLRNRYSKATNLPLHSTSVTADMSSYHAFNEIHPDTPAAIIETGFLNLDREILTKQPDVVASGVVNGIICFLNNEPIDQPTVAVPLTPPVLPTPQTPPLVTP